MNIKQVKTAFSSKENTPCPLTEKLVNAGYQQTSGGYIERARKENIEVNFKKNLPSQYWHIMTYCNSRNETCTFGKSIVCGELIFWMAEVLECVPTDEMEKLLIEIKNSRVTTDNGTFQYDRKRWNKAIQNLCFDNIVEKVLEITEV